MVGSKLFSQVIRIDLKKFPYERIKSISDGRWPLLLKASDSWLRPICASLRLAITFHATCHPRGPSTPPPPHSIPCFPQERTSVWFGSRAQAVEVEALPGLPPPHSLPM